MFADTHTPWIQSAATCRLRNARRQSEKRPWDSPGAFSYAIGELQMHLEGSLAVFLGYVLVFPLSLFDFRANAALNRLSEAFRLSQTGDFPATPRLSATIVARLPSRLRLPATPSDSTTPSDSPTLRLSATFDFRPAVDRHPPTTLRDTARHAQTPRGRHDLPRRCRNDPARRGGTRLRARRKHAQTPLPHMARKVAKKVYKSY